MKIAYVVDHFPLISETFVFSQIAGMIERGHEVTIFANRLISSETQHPIVDRYGLIGRTTVVPKLASSLSARVVQAAPIIIEGIRKGYFKSVLNSLNFFRYGRDALSLKLLIRVAPRFGNTEFDIIHCQFGHLAVEIEKLREYGALRGALVTSFRGWDATVFAKKFPGSYDALFKCGEVFLPVCGFLQGRLQKLGCPDIRTKVLYSGIDTEKLSFRGPREFNDPIRILTVGRLTEKKGVADCLRAVHILRNENWAIQYQIAGAGPLRQSLQDLATDLGIGSSVKFLGAVDSDKVSELLGAADIFVASSTAGKHGDAEGIPNSIKEAMAIGVPVVSTNHGGIPELVRDNIDGYLVEENSPDKLAMAIKRVREDSAARERMIRSARQAVQERFDISSLNSTLESIYMRLVEEKSSCCTN